ncbi:TIGR02569 family protein [Nocardioides sp. GXZ039]|uniref:TIGR02569 family protein n=1 Tax=Nocardioides sp. GXZ039 TaxID=3136018 RepID=UPI0030F40AFB
MCEVYAEWSCDDVRVPEPVEPHGTTHTHWSADGWGAHVFVPGRDLDLTRELERVREAGDAFHRAVGHLPRPPWIDDRDDPWAYGDRLAWEGAEPQGDVATADLINRLRAALEPVTEPGQVIHGDLLPNVLVDDGRPPAVIDWPPYVRPAGFASAIAVTDAVTFRGAPTALLEEWATGADWNQLLIRALLYRLGPTAVFAARNRLMGSLVTHLERVRPVAEVVLARAGGG